MIIRCNEAGQGNTPVVIFVHGAGGSSATWTMQLKNLSTHIHVVALDLNGHGATPDRASDDITASYLDDIKAIVSQYDHPILAGHSMGGALTQLYALEKPNHLAGIILVGTGVRLRVAPVIFHLLDNDFDGYVNALGEFAFHKDTPKEIVEASLLEVRKCPVRIIRRDFKLCDSFDIMDTVGNISLPTLILVGDNDQLTPPRYSAFLHKKIERAEYHIIEGAGHSVMLEQPTAVNEVIAKWAKAIT